LLITIRPPEMPELAADGLYRPTIYIERVSKLLARNSPLTQNEILKSDKIGKAEHVVRALTVMVEEGLITLQRKGQSKLYTHVRAFEAAAPTHSTA
jgi:hypothetical protein